MPKRKRNKKEDLRGRSRSGSRKAGFFADEAFTAKELVLQNLSDLSPDSAGFRKKAA
tara:strand:+ start:1930 stop:2100 length:171 start_codon:yes stop_codon:yes gene_type:complete